MPRKKKPAVATNYNLQGTWELHYVSYFLRVFKKLFNLKKAYTAELLEKEICYEAIQVQFGEEIAKIVEYLTNEEELGATSWEPVLEEQMCKNAVHPNILKGTDFSALDPEQRLQLLKILVDLVREVREEDIAEFGTTLKSKSLRFKAVGKDKHENKYWTFGSSRLFREFSKPNSKRFESVCTTPSEWEGFILTLRPSPNKNEKELHKSLKHVWGKIKDHIQLAQLKMKGHLELSQMAVKEHFELKRHAEAIEAIESNLDQPKMTKLVKMTTKPPKQKEKNKDGLISPMLGNRPILQNGGDKVSLVKKKQAKSKLKKQMMEKSKPNKIKARKMKENFLLRNSNCSSKNSSSGSNKTRVVFEDDPYSPENLSKDEDEEEPAISDELRRKIEMDDPGIDLSVFKPLGKRKCVIEMEERKGKPWYEGNDASDEETPEPNYTNTKEIPKKKKRKMKAPEPTIPDPPIIKTTATSNRSFVFSTALANRGAYEVIIKGKYNTIIAYHQAQKWPKAYLQHHIHCEPFVPEELKNEPALYSSDDASVKSYKSSEDENMRPVPKIKKKPRKKPVRKYSDASATASVSSPASLATIHSTDKSDENLTSTRNIEQSDHESLSSDREHLHSDAEMYPSDRDRIPSDNTDVFSDSKNSIQAKPNIKDWQKMHKIGMETQIYQEYHRYLYNNNDRKMDMQFFPPGMPNYRSSQLQKGPNSSRGRKAQNLSKPRPSPLNQPSLSAMQHIPDQLSDDDDDDDSLASDNEDEKDKDIIKDRELQSIIDSPKAPESADFNKHSEFLSEQPASPASSKHSLSDVSLQGRDREKLLDRLTDSSSSGSPITRHPPQAASVISISKTNNTPYRMSTPSETLSSSPRNSPQLSPFAAYRGRPATYPAEIVNPKPPTSSTPPKAIPDSDKMDNEKGHDMISDIVNNHNSNSSSGMSRPTTLQLGNKDSPMQHPQPPAYSNSVDQRKMSMPQVSDPSSVIQRPNPSPISVDNLCSPAIPMHQMKSPPMPSKSSSSPIFIHDIMNGNVRVPSPISPALGNKSNGTSSNAHSVISPVIANRMHEAPISRSRNSPVIQAYSSAPMSVSAQRIPSPVQLANPHMQRMPLHPGQPDPNLLSAFYRQHRMTRLPCSTKHNARGQNSVNEDQRRNPGMIHNQQAKAYQGLSHGIPKDASQMSQFAQQSAEQGHAFHGVSPHNSQEGSRSIHGSLQGMPDSIKSHHSMSRSVSGDLSRSLLGLTHNSQESSRSYMGMHLTGQDAARTQHSLARPSDNSPRLHLGLSASSQEASRTISGMAQSAQEATRNVLGVSHNNQESSRNHPAASHSGQETSRSHHAVPHISAQELSRSHHPLSHVLHEQSRYPGMPHSFHHGLNRTLQESPRARSLHEAAQHGVRPSVQGHSFQQGLRNISESPVGKSPPTQSMFHHAHGREFPSPSTGLKSYSSSLMERTLLEHQHSRLLEHQQQQRLLAQEQQTRKSFSVESLTASSEAGERQKGQCLNGQPTTPSALSRPGYSPSQRSHVFGHFQAYARGPSPEFFKLPPHVQQLYASRGALGPYMNFPHFKG